MAGCNQAVDKPSPTTPDSTNTLLTSHCGRCHSLPSPADLDKNTWATHILPRMGYFLGIYASDTLRSALLETPALESVFPASPQLTTAEWEKICDYFLTLSPDSLPRYEPPPAKEQTLFKPHFSPIFSSPPGTIDLLFSKYGGYYASDIHKEQVWWSQPPNELRAGNKIPGGVVDITETPNGLYFTCIGNFSPTDVPSGSIYFQPNNPQAKSQLIIQQLIRPVHTSIADINDDGYDDLVVAEFGKWNGQLSWWEGQESNTFRQHILSRQTGPIKTDIRDYDGDGRKDVLALFGQGDEGFRLFLNQGANRFVEKKLLSFPPSWGSSDFQIVDWNHDGAPDILYCNGDNADYTPLLKPYHGIRIFINQQLNFSEVLFLPLHGAYSCQAADFDLDNDLDIAAISFFPDFAKAPGRSIVFFDNEGGAGFREHVFPQAPLGRWISMDLGDPDRDGDTDWIVGSLAFEVIPPGNHLNQWITNGLGWIYFENLTRK